MFNLDGASPCIVSFDHHLKLQLYEASKKRPESFAPVTFHRFAYDRGLKHKWICTAEELPDLIL